MPQDRREPLGPECVLTRLEKLSTLVNSDFPIFLLRTGVCVCVVGPGVKKPPI